MAGKWKALPTSLEETREGELGRGRTPREKWRGVESGVIGRKGIGNSGSHHIT